MADKKEKYVVTQKHTLDHKVGTVISLTEKRAASLVNKVQLQSELSLAGKPAQAIKDLEDENSKLSDEMTTLVDENTKLINEIKELKKPAK